jgi:hypothetical protein
MYVYIHNQWRQIEGQTMIAVEIDRHPAVSM